MSDPIHLRRFQRVHLEVEVTMYSDHNFYSGITDNVSTGGIFVATHHPPPVGSQIDLVLHLPGSVGFRLQGEVRWIRSFEQCGDGIAPGCGIAWHQLTLDAWRAISAFVSERETVFHEGCA